MKAEVYAMENLKMQTSCISGETEEEICKQVFELEVESNYNKQVIAVRFENQQLLIWKPVYANYCFGKGDITFGQLKKICSNRPVYASLN